MKSRADFSGTQINTYNIGPLIGHGPYAWVYSCRHIDAPQKTVALKLMDGALLSTSQQKVRFLQEVYLITLLKHPHLLPTLDVGIYQDEPYLVTEFAPKGSLRAQLDQAPFSPRPLKETLSLLTQVAEVLNYIHQYDIVHANLKPENILLKGNGEIQLSDFRLSSVIDLMYSKYPPTASSVSYQAPEQFRKVISRSNDQYSLGCLAYELLTGRPPFVAADYRTMEQKHSTEEPIPLTHLNPVLPRKVEEVIQRALAKDPAKRHSSITVFIENLKEASASPILSATLDKNLQNGRSSKLPRVTIANRAIQPVMGTKTDLEAASIGSPIRTTKPQAVVPGTPGIEEALTENMLDIVKTSTTKKPSFNAIASTPRPELNSIASTPRPSVIQTSFKEQNLKNQATLPLIALRNHAFEAQKKVPKVAAAISGAIPFASASRKNAAASGGATTPSTRKKHLFATIVGLVALLNIIGISLIVLRPIAFPNSVQKNLTALSQVAPPKKQGGVKQQKSTAVPTKKAPTQVPMASPQQGMDPTPVPTDPPATQKNQTQPQPTQAPVAQPQPPQAPVQPILDCVSPLGDNGFVAYFGYNNQNDFPAALPIGTDNQFLAASSDFGQPAVFQPGEHHFAFNVSIGGGNLVWVLNGHKAVASRFSQQCH